MRGQEQERPKFQLPGKLETLKAILSDYYGRKGRMLLQKILVNSTHSVEEEYDYDGWDGGQSGHLVRMAIPSEIYFETLDSKASIEEELEKGFNKIDNTPHEHVAKVQLELRAGPEFKNWKERSGVLVEETSALPVSDEDINKIWISGHLRAFISHEAKHKEKATQFKDALLPCGISSFVAHEDIEVTKPWQDEIERALKTMHVMILLVTESFGSSFWTNQEIGFALGRGVLIIPVRTGADPVGFVSKYQALAGKGQKPADISRKIVSVMLKQKAIGEALIDSMINCFEKSPSYTQANSSMDFLELLETLSSEQISRLESAPKNNPNVETAYSVRNRLPNLLQRLKQGK
ncbi:MAG: toll/interleukin-1 receptor domain-containing protein [Deltaproteobacteria bacterium]|nr:toll/interleukin-1 receptor domain-containing protein [Deltaproteobacteria bacterium]